MSSQATTMREMARLAGLARIERSVMSTNETIDAAATARALWSAGDYHRFATTVGVWELGPVLVEACAIAPGDRVLDVAAGAGNVALRAAAAGADVVASDITPENLEAGRSAGLELGLELEWVQADAQELPFGDAEFDVVTSSVGAIFAPDHQAVADELVRVCRPGGRIGMINFTPEGLAAEFFEVFAPYGPPPPEGAQPPLLWGDEAHVGELFGDRIASLELERRELVERHPGGPAAYWGFYRQTFGPVVALRSQLADDPARLAAFDRDGLAFAERTNLGAPEGPAEYRYEYVVAVARRA
ncbi:MAG TPA: methyltransferase domain-containing protein [Solirubrobacteraceae bacterium]|nr:methyltransferase domain-containing protein [Solirubrobacteraceae bacterium]